MWTALTTVLRPLLGLASMLLVGTGIDLWLRVLPRATLARWPLRAVLAIGLLYLVMAMPIVAVVSVLVGWATRPRIGPTVTVPLGLRGERRRRDALIASVVAVVVTLVAALRPRVPLYWDEFVWLAKARIEAQTPFGLVPEVLRAGTDAIPTGYPPLEPLSVAALAGWDPRLPSLALGAAFLQIICALAFAFLALERSRGARASLGAAALLACSPLVLVHFRSAYVDFETGLLAGCLLLLLELRALRAAAIVAVVVVGLKDEGAIHVAAVTLVVLMASLIHKQERNALRAVVVGVVGLVPFIGWHLRLRVAGVVRTDHTLGGPAISRIGELGHVALVHLVDVLAWGPLWAVTLGLAIMVAVRHRCFGRSVRLRLAVLGAQATLLLFGLLATSERVMEFARAGTLIGRLLVEMAPMAMLAIAAAG